jgi:hypothetical protein
MPTAIHGPACPDVEGASGTRMSRLMQIAAIVIGVAVDPCCCNRRPCRTA